MERRGPRPRPGLCCQLIWPQSQAYSTTTNAVIIQLRLASVLFAVSFSRLLKMTVGCNPLLHPGIHTSANHSLYAVGKLSLGKRQPEAPSHAHSRCQRSVWNSCQPPIARLVWPACWALLSSLQLPKIFTSQALVPVHYEVHLLLCLRMHTSSGDLNYYLTMSLAWPPKGFPQLTAQSPLGAWLKLFWPQTSAFTSHLLTPTLLFPACQVPFNTACWFCSPHHICPNLIYPSVSLDTSSSRKPPLNPLK